MVVTRRGCDHDTEVAGDALTVHLSGTPKMDYEVASTYTAGQVTVAGSGFENTARSATAYVPINLPEEAFDLGGEEALAPAMATSDLDYSTVDGNTGKATVLLQADLGSFNDVTPESITLKGSFAGGKVESVSKEGEDGNVLKVEVSFPANGVSESDYDLAGTLRLAAGAMNERRERQARARGRVDRGRELRRGHGQERGRHQDRRLVRQT